MKLARVMDENGRIRSAVLQGESALLWDGALWDGVPEECGRAPLSSLRLLAPVLPPNIVCAGLNYKSHAQESGMALPPRPLLFLKATTSLCGPEDGIVLPPAAPDEVDYEAELAVVIGRRACAVSPGDAPRYVLGFTCANDVSARDCQLRLDSQWARGKSFDTFCPLGPCIETQPPALSCEITGRLNGECVQSARLSDLIFPLWELVSYCSHQMTLLPGTVILTGTPSGVGFARTPPRYLRPGDRFEVSISGIGTLSNPVR